MAVAATVLGRRWGGWTKGWTEFRGLDLMGRERGMSMDRNRTLEKDVKTYGTPVATDERK